MLKVLSYISCDLDPEVKVIGQKAGICSGVPSTSALVIYLLQLLKFVDIFSCLDEMFQKSCCTALLECSVKLIFPPYVRHVAVKPNF